jgi:hypothetical protein
MADINAESLWQKGMQWMTLPSDSLPKTQVKVPAGENEKKDYESELFPEVYSRENPEDRLLFLDTAGRPLSDESVTPSLTGCGPSTFDKELAPQDQNINEEVNWSSHVSVTLPFKSPPRSPHLHVEAIAPRPSEGEVQQRRVLLLHDVP